MPKKQIGLWWKAERPEEAAKDLTDTVHCLLDLDRRRRDDLIYHMALYGDELAKQSIRGYDRFRQGDRLTFNLVKSVIDTAQAEIAQLSPKPTFLTQRGNWSLRKKAQAMELMVEGEYDRAHVYELGPEGFLNAAKEGSGYLKAGSVGGRVLIDPMFPGEVLVDPVEAQYGAPRTLYHIRPVPRDALLDEFTFGADDEPPEGVNPKAEKAIRDAAEFDGRRWFPWLPSAHDSQLEQVLHIEAWRLPRPGTDEGGWHVRGVEGGWLQWRKWTRETFPIEGYTWQKEAGSFHGSGIVKELRPMQRELNYTLIKIQDCIHIGSTFRYLVEGNSKVNVEKIGNTPGEILRFFGAIPPQPQAVNAVPTDLLQHAEDLIRRGFEQVGVSLMSAVARKPAGLNSGAALREHEDIESRRFIIKSKAYERWLGVRLAKQVVAEKQAIAERGEEPEPVRAEVRRGRNLVIRHIDWKDAELDQDQYKVRVFPASALPSQPSGRTATVEQWFAAGWLTREQALQLLDFPDLEEFLSLELASHEIVLDAIERMIEDNQFTPPEPVMNHELALDLVMAAYQRHRWEGVPEERTELLLRYADDLRFFIEQAMQGEQGAQPGMPQQMPGPQQAQPPPAAVAAPILGPGMN